MAASLIACSYWFLSHISIIFIAEEITISLSIPAKEDRSLGINSLPAASSSTVLTPAVNLLMKSLFFSTKTIQFPHFFHQ